MKTIKNTQTGELQRVGNKDAEIKVKIGWTYCPKEEWKKIYNQKKEVNQETITKKSNSGKNNKRKTIG
jgi:hypothetical protein